MLTLAKSSNNKAVKMKSEKLILFEQFVFVKVTLCSCSCSCFIIEPYFSPSNRNKSHLNSPTWRTPSARLQTTARALCCLTRFQIKCIAVRTHMDNLYLFICSPACRVGKWESVVEDKRRETFRQADCGCTQRRAKSLACRLNSWWW